ncbi:MAG: putative metal-binding motif-containing protein [Lewinellaceae bacterium]|nr:putative metal-binding motif-containing protein [Lewinellaceae bacterium]
MVPRRRQWLTGTTLEFPGLFSTPTAGTALVLSGLRRLPASHYTAAELTQTSGDCDDSNANINPGAQEVCDGIDNDCDGWIDGADASLAGQGTWYADTDGDGFGDPNNSSLACSQPAGFVADNTDCDDTDASLGSTANDMDCDGVPTAEDCNDNDPALGSSANDMDCDGIPAGQDCDDNDAGITSFPGQPCDDGNPATFGETIQDDCSCGGGTTAPTTACSAIDSSPDDAEERVNGGRVDLNSSDLELGTDAQSQLVVPEVQQPQHPQGAFISSAYIQFQVDETRNDDPCELTIHGTRLPTMPLPSPMRTSTSAAAHPLPTP